LDAWREAGQKTEFFRCVIDRSENFGIAAPAGDG
jgi:hypothetical protein